MAKKTWIKVKRGILEPKHRRKLGSSWFLYFYMLDKTNLEDGTIHEWRDEAAAEELDIPLITLRGQRRKLEDEQYIQTTQKQYCLEIRVNNWTNPREYSGKVYNEVKQTFQGDENLTHKNEQGDNQGDSHGNQNLTPLHRINIITLTHDKEYLTDEELITQFAEISKVAYVPGALQERWEWASVLRRLHDNGITEDIMARACEGKSVTHPAQIMSDCQRMVTA